MARSVRVLYQAQHGRIRKNVNFAPIHQNSAVVISAAEFGFFGGIFGAAGRPKLDEATVYVTNVGPHDPEGGDGGVEFFLHVEGPAPVDVMVTISVLEDVETTFTA
jgi:hypothetical protein